MPGLVEFLRARVDEDEARYPTYVTGWLAEQRRAECVSKRRMLERFERWLEPERNGDPLQIAALALTMDMAIPYVNHPGFHKSWAWKS